MRFGPLNPREKLTLSVTTADTREFRIAELERRIAALRSELLSNDELLIRVRDEMARERPNSSFEVWPFIQGPILKSINENSGSIMWRLWAQRRVDLQGECYDACIVALKVNSTLCSQSPHNRTWTSTLMCRPQSWSCRCARSGAPNWDNRDASIGDVASLQAGRGRLPQGWFAAVHNFIQQLFE